MNSASLLPFLLSKIWKWAGGEVFCFIFEKYFWRNAFDTHIFSYNDLMIKYTVPVGTLPVTRHPGPVLYLTGYRGVYK